MGSRVVREFPKAPAAQAANAGSFDSAVARFAATAALRMTLHNRRRKSHSLSAKTRMQGSQ
jgi:hypothetical protein